MNIREVIERLEVEAADLIDGSEGLPVVLVVASCEVTPTPNNVRRGEVVDVQPCLWNEKTGEAISIDDVDVGPGFVRAVALLTKGAS